MPLDQVDFVTSPIVHGLCKSGFHEQCKMFEEWNFEAKCPCACPDCDHPFPDPPKRNTREAAPFLLDDATPTSEERTVTENDDEPVDSPEQTEVSSRSAETPVEPSASPNKEHDNMATATKDDKSTKSTGRGRGELEAQVLKVAEDFENDKIELPDGQALTPHYIAKTIAENEGLDKPPSTGAVAAVIKRWDEYGFALTDEKPYAFRRRSAAGKKQGLEALKQKHRDRLKAERAAAKEAESGD